ncbi:MAG: amidohydrolase family protein, partial [Candidatus Aminicenantales bacterium]
MRRFFRAISGFVPVYVLAAFLLIPGACRRNVEPTDLVLLNGHIQTVNPAAPRAGYLAVKGNTITAVGEKESEARRYVGPATRVIDLAGQFVLPGIIDGHVHFNRAGALINDANLMTVADEQGLRREIGRVVDLLDDGEWITEGLWGAYEQWDLGDAGRGERREKTMWRPNRAMIDDLTIANPCFLCRYDYKEWLANTAALEAAGVRANKIEGLELGRDGKPTGIVFRPSPAFTTVSQAVKPKSRERLLDENRAALKALREAGIVEIHDIEVPDQTERFIALQENGELTCRVWLRPDLSRGAELGTAGFTM